MGVGRPIGVPCHLVDNLLDDPQPVFVERQPKEARSRKGIGLEDTKGKSGSQSREKPSHKDDDQSGGKIGFLPVRDQAGNASQHDDSQNGQGVDLAGPGQPDEKTKQAEVNQVRPGNPFIGSVDGNCPKRKVKTGEDKDCGKRIHREVMRELNLEDCRRAQSRRQSTQPACCTECFAKI